MPELIVIESVEQLREVYGNRDGNKLVDNEVWFSGELACECDDGVVEAILDEGSDRRVIGIIGEDGELYDARYWVRIHHEGRAYDLEDCYAWRPFDETGEDPDTFHRLGPWVAELNNPLATIPGHLIKSADYPNTPIASLWEGGGSRGKQGQIANAYLVAAAPQLLEFVGKIVTDYAEKIDDGKQPTDEEKTQYEEALAIVMKATGNAPLKKCCDRDTDNDGNCDQHPHGI